MSQPRGLHDPPVRGDSAGVSASLLNATAEPPAINLFWLVRLRFFSLAGQLATILFVSLFMRVELSLVPIFGVLALGLLSNLAALARIRRRPLAATPLLGTLLVYDVLHLTGLLYLTGGPFNPFSFTYLVLIALATVVLRERQVWMLAALSAACSALLFLRHRPLILPGGHAEHMRTHLYGMWVAFLIAAGFIVYFLVRIRRALDDRESALREAQQLGSCAVFHGDQNKLFEAPATYEKVTTDEIKALAARLLGVSRAGYYAWAGRRDTLSSATARRWTWRGTPPWPGSTP